MASKKTSFAPIRRAVLRAAKKTGMPMHKAQALLDRLKRVHARAKPQPKFDLASYDPDHDLSLTLATVQSVKRRQAAGLIPTSAGMRRLAHPVDAKKGRENSKKASASWIARHRNGGRGK